MAITRVHYRERQRLLAADLRAEQDYRIAIAGRHHIGPHRWGVVRGLRVVQDTFGTWTLTSGVAIDGYGREILVAQPTPLPDQELEGCAYVTLYYCESPEIACAGRDGARAAPSRINQGFVIQMEQTRSLPAEIEDLELARAAGSTPELAPWPVVAARVGRECSDAREVSVDYSETRYVGHRASSIRSPTGRALLQLGLSSHSDLYHFLLSTLGDGAAPARRLGIDRDHVVHVWRALYVTGPDAVGQAAVSAKQTLKITTVMPAGAGRRLLVAARVDAHKKELTASLLDLRANTRIATSHPIALSPSKTLSTELEFGASQRATLRLVDHENKLVRLFHKVPGAPKETPPAPAFEQTTVELQPAGGHLVMQSADPEPVDVPKVECGDVPRTRSPSEAPGTPVVQLEVADALPLDPLAREIHAVADPPGGLVAHSVLRISGGAGEDTDRSSRFGIGGRIQGHWVSALTMDGGRRIDIHGLQAALPLPTLNVEGTLYLPPIGPKDPFLQVLMAKAFAGGLRQMGKIATQVELIFMSYPSQIKRGDPLAYTIKISNHGQPLVIKRCFEMIGGTDGSHDVAVRALNAVTGSIAHSAHQSFNVTYTGFTHAASKIRIEIEMLVSIGNTTMVALQKVIPAPDISVTDP